MRMDRRAFMKTGLGGAAALASPSLLRPAIAADTIDVGVLFSLTGGLSIILLHTLAEHIFEGKLSHPRCITRIGRFPIPNNRLGVVLRHPISI